MTCELEEILSLSKRLSKKPFQTCLLETRCKHVTKVDNFVTLAGKAADEGDPESVDKRAEVLDFATYRKRERTLIGNVRESSEKLVFSICVNALCNS